jgi:Fe2+ or Zn2+ uptake regulation protein
MRIILILMASYQEPEELPTPAVDRQIEAKLNDRGLRYTPGRRAVVTVLLAADGPLSVAEIHQALHGKEPLSSLYRSCAVMEKAGTISPHTARGLTRYELAEWLTGHHHHLICTECGSIEDFTLPADMEATFGTLIGDVAGSHGFLATDHMLEISGMCRRCR